MAYGWEQLTPAHSPSQRWGFAMAYDHSRDVVVVFGGATAGVPTYNLVHETWEWDGTDWTQITTTHFPSARFLCNMGFDPATGKMILFGGETLSGILHETWTYDGSDWTQLTPTHAPSGSTTQTTLVYDQNNGNLLGWEDLDGTTLFGKTWIWDGSDWIVQSPSTVPPHRFSSLTYDANRQLVVMGPGNFAGNTFQYYDVWLWDGTDWTNDTASRPTEPFPPFNNITGFVWEYSSFCKGCIMFSGNDGNSDNLQETWQYDASGWIDLAPSSPPTGRSATGSAKDPATGKIMMFGGLEGDNTTMHNDTWLFSCPPTAWPTMNNEISLI